MTITKDIIDITRPGLGIYPKFLKKVIGSTAKQDIPEGTTTQFDDITQN